MSSNEGSFRVRDHALVLGILAGLAVACSSKGGGSGGGSGGSSPGSGGTLSTGGTTAGSGGVGSGGVTGSGGASSSGGQGGSAGGTGTGGANSGGAVGTGGASSTGGTSTSPGTGGAPSGGAGGGVGGATGTGGSTVVGTGGSATGGTSTSGTGGTTSGAGGATSKGGAIGTGGASDAGADGPPSAKSFTCNTVLGIDSTSEWYTGGFENQVTDSKWQLIYNHPGYVEDWGIATDAVYSKAPTSPCAANSDNPDRVILNVFADPSGSLTTSAALVTGLSKAVDTLKSKYSRLKRLDLLTMSRGPNNQQCFSSSNTVVAAYVDDAIAKVVTAYPGMVTASPKFYVTACSDFDSTNPPHLSTTGKTNVAKVYGDYYSTEP